MGAPLLPADERFWGEIGSGLAASSSATLVLERWARGAGQRSWYLLRALADIELARLRVRPGSSLTAYRSPTLAIQGAWSAALADETRRLLAELGPHEELVALVDHGSAPLLHAEYISDADDLPAWEAEAAGRMVWIGKYPDWPEDSDDVLTRVVPDADGVVRAYAY